MKQIILKLIKLYQRTLSPDHGWPKRFYPHGFCRFHPTCSQYSYESIKKHGIVKGGLKTAWRVLRCNPFSKGGNDPA